jgi:hypothetical protein
MGELLETSFPINSNEDVLIRIVSGYGHKVGCDALFLDTLQSVSCEHYDDFCLIKISSNLGILGRELRLTSVVTRVSKIDNTSLKYHFTIGQKPYKPTLKTGEFTEGKNKDIYGASITFYASKAKVKSDVY